MSTAIQQKFHWWCITFQFNQMRGCVLKKNISSYYCRFPSKNITRKDLIAEITRNNLDANETAILNSMYLGYMTEDEFLNT